MYSKRTAIAKVRAFCEAIIATGVSLDAVYLFGSYVRGEQHKDSDIDVALISTQFSGFGFEDRKLFSKINIRKEFVEIETKTFSSEYFAKGDPFIEEIIQTGIKISISAAIAAKK